MIEITNLSKLYKSRKQKHCLALDNVSFKLPDTGLIFIVGKSGSGKSTLLNLIGGLDSITSGDIICDGNHMREFKEKDFNKYRSSYVSFVFQDYHLFDTMTVFENIEMAVDHSKDKSKDRINVLLEKVGLSEYQNKYPTELSGGQRQRVGIARALAKDSHLILADEPTGNLDKDTTTSILEILKETSKEKLVIIVSHNLIDADRYADRIIELQDGKIIADKIRKSNFKNQFNINNGTITLPHYNNLTDEELNQFNELLKNNEFENIIQLDNGFIDTNNDDIKSVKEKVKLEYYKSTKVSFFNLLKTLFKKRMHIRFTAIFFSVALFIVLSLLQSFVLFDISQNNIKEEEPYLVLTKGSRLPEDTSLRSGYIYSIDEEEFKAFDELTNGNYYKLINKSLNINADSNRTEYMFTNDIERNLPDFYLKNGYGTLLCNENYLVDLYGINGKLEYVIENPNKLDYGVIITDYVADSILYYRSANFKGYEDLMTSKVESILHFYINGIIKTNYQDRYNELIDIVENAEENQEYSLYSSNKNLYYKFSEEVTKYLGVNYSYNPDFINALMESVIYDNATFNVRLETEQYSYKGGTNFKVSKTLNESEIYLNTTTYNKIFGTNYSSTNVEIPENQKIQVTYPNYTDDNKIIIKEYTVKGLRQYNYLNKKDFSDMFHKRFSCFALYFENSSQNTDLIKLGKEHNFYVQNCDIYSGIIINKLTYSFESLFFILLIVVYFILFMYIFIYGLKCYSTSKYEIGVIQSLGGKVQNLSLVFMLDVFITGIVIMILSYIVTPIMINIANNILLDSFGNILKVQVFNLEILAQHPYIESLNLGLLQLTIILTPLISLLIYRKAKIINMIKATYTEV